MRPGSAVRAWVVGHDGFRVGAAIGVEGAAVSLYAYARVPSIDGGPVPMWFLTPPALAMLAGLAVRNAVEDAGWWSTQRRWARLGWAIVVILAAAATAALVGTSAGQERLPEWTVLLTAVTFGLATMVGRGSAALGAGCLVAVVGSTRLLHAHTPASLWERLTLPGQAAAGALAVAGVVAYAAVGSRRSRDEPVD